MPSEKGKDKSSKPNYMQRCVGDLIAQGKSKEAAFAICTATMQKAGYLTKGPGMEQTAKGEKRARQFAQQKDNKKKLADYEKAIKAESVLGGLAAQLVACVTPVAEARNFGSQNEKAMFDSDLLPENQGRVWVEELNKVLFKARDAVREAIIKAGREEDGLGDEIRQDAYELSDGTLANVVGIVERVRRSIMLPAHKRYEFMAMEDGSVTDAVLADAAARALVQHLELDARIDDTTYEILAKINSSVWE